MEQGNDTPGAKPELKSNIRGNKKMRLAVIIVLLVIALVIYFLI